MAERKREVVARRHEIDLFSKNLKLTIKLREENRKPLIKAKPHDLKLMDDESLFLETATNRSSKNGSKNLAKSEN